MDRPILYSFRRCPYAMRARLAIRSSETTVELREILLRDKAPAFLEASPSATVPALVRPGEAVIDESLDIMIWALERHDPEGWLEPDDGSRREMLALIADNDGPFKLHLDRYKYHTRYEDADAGEERRRSADFLRNLNGRLATRGWLFGDRASLADMAILPFVRQFANTDRPWFDAQDWPRLGAWLKAFEMSGRFAAIMDKYPRWVEGDPVTLFGS